MPSLLYCNFTEILKFDLCVQSCSFLSLVLLQYAELKPVPCLSYADAVKLRESSATPILTQVLCTSDVILVILVFEVYFCDKNFKKSIGENCPRLKNN